jgi:fatty acid CoA ligase FadD9
MINFDLSLLTIFQFIAPAIPIVALYCLYIRPSRLASADRWRVHEQRTRRAHGCQRCGRRVWPGEFIFCCGECESDYRWCEACYRSGGDAPHRHRMFRELIFLEPDVSVLERVDSVPHALLTALKLYSPRFCLGSRSSGDEFEWLTYAQVRRLSVAFARRLLARHRVGDILWLMAAPTCGPARFIAQYGALLAGLLVVPLHSSTSAETLAQIAKRAPPMCIVADLDAVRDRLPPVGRAEVLDVAVALDGDDESVSDDDIEQHIVQFARKPERFAMLLPSSGSTGVPKLTITTDGMLLQQVVVPRMGGDHCLLAHQSELNQTLDMLCKGGRIGTATALDEIELDLKALRPSVHGAVPVFWQGLKCRYEQMVVDAGGDEDDALRRFRALKLLGNRCTIAIVGGAKCSPQLKDFIWRAFECVVTDGYGATEVGGLAANGNVSSAVELRLIDAPDVGYMTTDVPPRGEIVARSKRISPGYFGDEDETRRNFVDLGGQRFYRTGDIGTLQDGRVTVIDRRGALCKLAQGVFVAPSRLEAMFEAEPEIAGCFVYGNSDMFNVAAVVKLASSSSSSEGEMTSAAAAAAALRRAAERHSLKAFERPVNIIVDSSDWSDLFTSIGKKQRTRFAERFGARLTAPPEPSDGAATTATGASGLCTGLVSLLNSHLVSVQGRAASLSPALTLAEVGADSLALARLSAAIKEQLQREIPIAQLVKLTLESLQGFLYGGLSLRDALAASSAIDWQAEAERAVAEVPRTAPTNTTSSSSTAVPCVLLTGCTGFLGAFLLRRLLDDDERTIIYCLVRCPGTDASLFGRITDTMTNYGRALSAQDLARVRPVRGDLSLPQFGLVSDDYAALVTELRHASRATVLHNGATVSSASSFGALRAANVLGTLTALRVAEAIGAYFCHVSSVGFLGGQREEAPVDASRLALEVLSGYAQSKCVAELALQVAQPRVPTLIVRSGTVCGATNDGATNAHDSVMNLMLGLARERIVVHSQDPSPFPSMFAMMPVDTTADVIAKLCSARATGVVNLLCREQLSFDDIVAAVRAEGGAVSEIDGAQFRARVDAIDDSLHPWFTLKSVLASTVSSFATTRDNSMLPLNDRVRALWPTTVERAPSVDDLRRMLRWLQRRRINSSNNN